MNERGVVRWWRVIAYGIATIVATFVVGGALSAATSHEVGRMVGRFSIPAVVLACTASYQAQVGAARVTRIVSALVITGAGACLALGLRYRGLHALPELTAADRAALVDDGTRLHHPTFGFSIAKPAEYAIAPKVAEAMHADANSIAYAYAGHGGAVVVEIVPLTAVLADDVPSSIRTFQTGIIEGASNAGSNQVLRQAVTGSGESTTGSLDFISLGVTIHESTHVVRRHRRDWFAVAVMTMSQAGSLDGELDSYRRD